DTNGHDVTITGGISGFGVNKAGPGTLALSGSTSWSGFTRIQAGTLALTGTTGYTGDTDVASGARLAFLTSGNIQVAGALTGGGVVEIGGGTNIAFNLLGGGTFAPDVITDASDSTITVIGGTVTGAISGSGRLVAKSGFVTLTADN